MKLPFTKRKLEKKTGDSLVQYQQGIYYIGTSGQSNQRLKDYITGYRVSDTVYSCVNLIVQSAVLVPWYVYRDNAQGDVTEIEKHPLVDWMKKPGPGLDWTEFLTRSLSFYLTSGNCYIHKLVGSFGKYGQLEVLRPQFMTIKLNKDGTLAPYEYRVGGQVIFFPPEEIIHVKTFNPEDPLYGLSPIQVLARKIDIGQFGELWTIALLENEARPSGALTLKQPLTEDQRKQLREQLTDTIQGYQNAGKPLILEGDWDWKQFSFTPKEVEYLHSKEAVMREICAAYKVAPELFGDSANKTYSNVKEARKALYQEAVIPLLGKFKNAFNEQIVPAFDQSGVYLDYDVSGIDALSEDLDLLWTRVLAAKTQGTITREEAREEMGYGELDAPDTLSENVSVISTPIDEVGQPTPEPPAPVVVAPPPNSMPEPMPPDAQPKKPVEPAPKKPKKSGFIHVKGGFWQTPEKKEAKWNAFARRVQARGRSLDAIAKKYLVDQADRVRHNLKGAGAIGQINKWSVFDQHKEAEKFVKASMPWYIDSFTKAVRSGIASGKGEISDGEEKTWVFKPEYEAMLHDMVVKSGTKIAESTMEEVLDLLQTAEEESWTVEEFANAVKNQLEDRSPMRARRIARTEAGKVENYGELEGYKETEFVEFKGWLCSFLEHSRKGHMEADGRYSTDPIPLEDPFEVECDSTGGMEQLMCPLDGSLGASAGNIIECKCTLFPQVKEL